MALKRRTHSVLPVLSNESYLDVVARKRTWTPVAVDKGEPEGRLGRISVPGSGPSLSRTTCQRFLQQGLEKDLPDKPGVVEALMSNQADEDKHDLGLSYVVNAHGVDDKAESEAQRILNAWLDAPEHPILKASILEEVYSSCYCRISDSTGTLASGPSPQISAETRLPTLQSTEWSHMTSD